MVYETLNNGLMIPLSWVWDLWSDKHTYTYDGDRLWISPI